MATTIKLTINGDAPREKVKLPKRQKQGGYRESNYPFKFIKERY